MERMDDRRRRPRLPLSLRASIRRRGGSQRWDAQTENLSCDGVCFRVEESFGLGELIEIRLDLDGILGPPLRCNGLVCLGRVVQAESDDPAAPYRYGCKILDYALEPVEVANGRRPRAAVQTVGAP